MKVAVIGAGIVGVCCAWELRREGHEVSVFERHASVAEECSFANAGVIAPGYVTPWASPGMPWKVISQIGARHAAVRFGRRLPLTLPWLWAFVRACSRPVHEANRDAMRRLALFSRVLMQDLTAELDMAFEQSRGYLVLARSSRELDRLGAATAGLRALGIKAQPVDAKACRRLEPGLRPDTVLAGGVHLEEDLSGNCRAFAQILKARGQDRGIDFRFGTEVNRLVPGAQVLVHAVSTDTRREESQGRGSALPRTEAFDAVVVCAGASSTRLLGPLGLRLPLLPIYGYSMTAPLQPSGQALLDAPRSSVMDERFKVAITRLGNHVRVAGSAEIGGHPERMNEAAQRTLYKVLEDWFPGVCDLSRARQWKGGRPMLPDGPPLIGRSGIEGVWLNLGHGSSGWALALGCARLLCETLAGRPVSVPVQRLSIERLGRTAR